MAFLGRKTLKSQRARMRRVDMVFERLGQGLLILYFIFFTATWVTERESIRIDKVAVLGVQMVDGGSVERIAYHYLNENFLWKINRDNAFLYPKQNMSAAVLALDSHIKSVETDVLSAKLLNVKVVEYEPKYLWCDGEVAQAEASTTPDRKCYLADDAGYIFSDAPNYSGYPFDVYLTSIAGSEEQESPIGLHMLSADEFGKVQTFIAVLEDAGTSVVLVEQLNEHDYSLSSEKPWVILWSSEKDPVKSVETIGLATAEIQREKKGTTTLSTIDVRFGNKIFYK